MDGLPLLVDEGVLGVIPKKLERFAGGLHCLLEAIDRLKVTASSHQRAFLVEVMGRDCGYLATAVGIASGEPVPVAAVMSAGRVEQVGQGGQVGETCA